MWQLLERKMSFLFLFVYYYYYYFLPSAFLFFFFLLFCYPHFFSIRIFLSAFSHPHPPSAGIRSAFYRHPFLSDIFGLLSSRNFATIATWRNNLSIWPPFRCFVHKYGRCEVMWKRFLCVGLLFTHKNSCGGVISVTERRCSGPISKVEGHISDRFGVVWTPVRSVAEVNK